MNIKDQFDQMDLKQAVMLGVILAVIYYAAFFDDGKALDGQAKGIQQQINTQKATLQNVEKAVSDRDKFQKDIKDINTHMRDFLSYFPLRVNRNKWIEKVSKAAEVHSLAIVTIKPIEVESEFKDYPETAVEFKVEGDFHQIMKFLSQLTQEKRAVDFKEMTFKVIKRNDIPSVELTSRLIVYSGSETRGEG